MLAADDCAATADDDGLDEPRVLQQAMKHRVSVSTYGDFDNVCSSNRRSLPPTISLSGRIVCYGVVVFCCCFFDVFVPRTKRL